MECCRYLVFKLNNYMELFKPVTAYIYISRLLFIYLFSKIMKFVQNITKPIEKLSRLHFKNCFDVSKVMDKL